jgi:hypothetical protein
MNRLSTLTSIAAVDLLRVLQQRRGGYHRNDHQFSQELNFASVQGPSKRAARRDADNIPCIETNKSYILFSYLLKSSQNMATLQPRAKHSIQLLDGHAYPMHVREEGRDVCKLHEEQPYVVPEELQWNGEKTFTNRRWQNHNRRVHHFSSDRDPNQKQRPRENTNSA